MSNQETNYKECEGCEGCGIYTTDHECMLKPYYIDKQGNKIVCPCSTCLIKMICNKPCINLTGYNNSNRSYREVMSIKI